MSGSTRAGLAALLLVVVWIVVYWRTLPGGSDRGMTGTAEAPPSGAFTARLADHTAGVAPVQTNQPLTPPEPAPLPSTLRDTSSGGGTPVGADSAKVDGDRSVAAAPPAPPQPKPGETIPPTFDLYEVQAGDNAQTISRKRYGTTKHWRAILKANPLLDFTRLRPGRVIKVPHDPDNTQGVVVPADSIEFVEYTVAPGDTLIGISQALYGKSSLWRDIQRANPELNEDGTNLRPGMKLKVPPPAGAAQGVRSSPSPR